MAKVGYFNYGLNILWSLSVEEVFYFTFPLLCLLLRRPRWIVPVWVAAILFGPIYRSWHADDEIRFLYGYFACFDAIAMGCCVAILARWMKDRHLALGSRARTCIQLAAGAFIAWIYLREAIGDSPVFGPSLVALGAAIFVFAEAIWKPAVNSPRARWEPVGWLGQRSYELYLFHIVVLALMRNIVERGHLQPAWKPLWFLVFLVASTAVAYAIARLYSEPLNRRIRLLDEPSASSTNLSASPAL
jgi:peptidoglycan/LPS O-acetylase OafA/YrhL